MRHPRRKRRNRRSGGPQTGAPKPLTRNLGLECLEDRRLLNGIPLTDFQRRAVEDGLLGLVAWAEDFEGSDELARPISIVRDPSTQQTETLGSLLDFSTILERNLLTPAEQYLAAEGQAASFSGLVQAIGGADISTNDELLTSVQLADASISLVEIDLPQLLGAPNLAVDTSQSVSADFEASVSFALQVGLDLNAGLSLSDAFFIRATQISFDGRVDAGGLALQFDYGMLGLTSSAGDLDLQIQTDASLLNPDADASGNLTLAEMQESTFSELADMSATTGTLTAAFPVTPTATSDGSNRFSLSSSTSIAISADPLGGTTPEVTLAGAGADELRTYTRIDSDQLLDALEDLGQWLDSFGNSEQFSQPIPFVSGHSFGRSLELGEVFADQVVTPLLTVDSQPSFGNLQEFTEQLASNLGLGLANIGASKPSNSNRLLFHVGLASHTFPPTQEELTFDVDLSPLRDIEQDYDLPATAQVEIAADSIQFDVEIDLSPFTAQLHGTRDLPVDGIMSADANFEISVNGSAPVPVVVARNASNATANDLVADVNQALSTAGMNSVQAVLTGERMLLVGDAIDETAVILVTSAPDDPTVTELGIAEAVQPGIGMLQADAPPPENGLLSADATFQLSVNGEDPVTITVFQADTAPPPPPPQ